MKPAVLAAVAALAASGDLAAQAPDTLSQEVRRFVAVDAPVVALAHVRVIDGTGAPPRDDQTIVLRGGSIAEVGPAARVRVPQGAHVMELRGHTVIPGLVGMHNHTFYTTANRRSQITYSAPRLYLASGVTTIRTTGSYAPYSELNLKRDIEAGRSPGPRMHVTGPYITGPEGGYMTEVPSAEDARRVVAYWAEEGATWIKAYTRISREALEAAIDEAHKRGIKVTGHLCSVSFREAVALGIDNLEHGLFTNSDYAPDKQPDTCPQTLTASVRDVDLKSPAVQETFREMIAKNVGMTSTLAVYELTIPNRPPLDPRVVEALSPEFEQDYLATREEVAKRTTPSDRPTVFRKAQEYERAFVEAGGLLAAGVDPTGVGGALPGYGDQRNYELLLEAGFTPAQVIRIMSLNGAKILGEDKRLGSIEAGKLADLVVIRGDPVATPSDIRNVTLVFKGGIGYDSAKLIESVKGLVGVR